MEKLTDKFVDRINRSCLMFVLMPLGAIVVLTLFCGKLIYNCVSGPFPVDVAQLSSMKSPDLENKYYVTVNGVKAVPTAYIFASKDSDGQVKNEDATAQVVLLSLPPRLLLVKTLHGELSTSYTGKLETVPSDLVALVKADVQHFPDIQHALLPKMLNVSEGIIGDLAVYEFFCLILGGIAIFNGVKLLIWKNVDRHPLTKALKKFGNVREIADQINQEGSDALNIDTITVTKSWLLFSKPFGVTILQAADMVWAYITASNDTKQPQGVCIWTKNGSSTIIPVQLAKREMLMKALSERAPWMYAGYDAKRWLAWKTKPQTVIDEVQERLRQATRK